MSRTQSIEQSIIQRLDAKLSTMAKTLREEADQLDRWVVESSTGGWSTHQVDPMRKRSAKIRETLIQLGV